MFIHVITISVLIYFPSIYYCLPTSDANQNEYQSQNSLQMIKDEISKLKDLAQILKDQQIVLDLIEDKQTSLTDKENATGNLNEDMTNTNVEIQNLKQELQLIKEYLNEKCNNKTILHPEKFKNQEKINIKELQKELELLKSSIINQNNKSLQENVNKNLTNSHEQLKKLLNEIRIEKIPNQTIKETKSSNKTNNEAVLKLLLQKLRSNSTRTTKNKELQNKHIPTLEINKNNSNIQSDNIENKELVGNIWNYNLKPINTLSLNHKLPSIDLNKYIINKNKQNSDENNKNISNHDKMLGGIWNFTNLQNPYLQKNNENTFFDQTGYETTEMLDLSKQRNANNERSSTSDLLKALIKENKKETSLEIDADDIKTTLKKLSRQLVTKPKKKNILEKQLKTIIKQLNNDDDDIETKTNDDDDLETIVKTLQKNMLNQDNESRNLEVSDDLLDLQKAIDDLRPDDETNENDQEFKQINSLGNLLLPLLTNLKRKPTQIQTIKKLLNQNKHPVKNDEYHGDFIMVEPPYNGDLQNYNSNPINNPINYQYPPWFYNNQPSSTNFYNKFIPGYQNPLGINSGYPNHMVNYPGVPQNGYGGDASYQHSYGGDKSYQNAYGVNKNNYGHYGIDKSYQNGYGVINKEYGIDKSYQNGYGVDKNYQNGHGIDKNGYSINKNNFFLDQNSNFPPYQNPAQVYQPNQQINGANAQQYQLNSPQTNIPEGQYTQQKLNEVNQQILNLQNIVNSLSQPNYVQKPEDYKTLQELEGQMNQLKNVIQNIDAPKPNQGYQIPPTPTLNVPSPPPVPIEQYQNPPNTQNQNPLIPLNTQNEKIQQTYARTSQNNKSRRVKRSNLDVGSLLNNLMEEESEHEDTNLIKKNTENVKNKLEALQKQLELKLQPPTNLIAKNSLQPYDMQTYSDDNSYESGENKGLDKKEGILEKTIGKIMDKIIKKLQIALPKITQKLLGLDFDFNGKNIGKQGVFGLLDVFPMFLVNVFTRIASFIDVLKRNKFLKTFLVPALIVLVIAASAIFLIWWLQPDNNNCNSENTYPYYPGYKTNAEVQFQPNFNEINAKASVDGTGQTGRYYTDGTRYQPYQLKNYPVKMYIPNEINYANNPYAVT